MNSSVFFLQADEIDHLTIKYTDFNEPLDKEKAIKFIRTYYSMYDIVKSEIDKYTSIYKLNDKSADELYKLLVIIRNILIKFSGI